MTPMLRDCVMNLLGAALAILILGLSMDFSGCKLYQGTPSEYDRQPMNYDTTITLPIEAFGANWHVEKFRKHVEFPNNFAVAFDRAGKASQMINREFGALPVISMYPRTWIIKEVIPISSNTTIRAGKATLDFMPPYLRVPACGPDNPSGYGSDCLPPRDFNYVDYFAKNDCADDELGVRCWKRSEAEIAEHIWKFEHPVNQ